MSAKNNAGYDSVHEDARTWRIFKKNPGGGPYGRLDFDVLAVYYTEEDGFLVFKDNCHKAVYAVAVNTVDEIVRLRTDTILAVSERTLKDILESLAEYAMRLELEMKSLVKDNKGTPFAISKESQDANAKKVKRLQDTYAWLQRGEGIAAERREEDPFSLEAVSA